MFGLSFTHLILLGLLALIFIGPEELPQVARTIGRFLNELKRGSDSFKGEFRKSTQGMKDDFRIVPPDFASSLLKTPEKSSNAQAVKSVEAAPLPPSDPQLDLFDQKPQERDPASDDLAQLGTVENKNHE